MTNIHKYTSYNNEFDSSFKNLVFCVCLLISEKVCIKFHKKRIWKMLKSIPFWKTASRENRQPK